MIFTFVVDKNEQKILEKGIDRPCTTDTEIKPAISPFQTGILLKIHILTVGDEILIGQTIDTNSAWMGRRLNLIGASIIEITSVGDDHGAITEGIRHALGNADVVLMTGGLGPTKDDITKKAIADFFGVDMVFDQPTFEHIVKMFERFGRPLSDTHRHQCFMPANALLLQNKMGTAPGIWFERGEQVIVSMPGVPFEMQWIMEKEVLPRLISRFPPSPVAHRTLLTAGTGETQLASMIEDFENSLPANVHLAYLPSLGQVKLRLTAHGTDQAEIESLLEQKKEELLDLVREHVYGFEEDTLEAAVGRMLKSENMTLSTAESCTGGYIAHLITSVPGSSAYYMGSIISYDNALKINQLKVSVETLQHFGAVSEQTVKEMVTGALRTLKTDVAIATSGIAGPDGGTPEKPVGTIWIAVGNKDRVITHKLTLGKDRLKNIEYTGNFALDMLRRFLR